MAPAALAAVRDSAPLHAFRRFRWTRPFWAGLLVLAAGLEIGVLPLGPTDALIHAGKGAVAALGCSLLLIAMGLVILLAPSQRLVAGVIAVLVSLASFPLSNLGGFVVGMLLGIVGGSLAFAWVPDKPARQRRRSDRSAAALAPPSVPDPDAGLDVVDRSAGRRRPLPPGTRRTPDPADGATP